jgi:AraC-like DNA-binding protein
MARSVNTHNKVVRRMIESLNFSTGVFAPAERFARYRDFYASGADAVDLATPVNAQVEAWRFGGLILYERRLTGVGTERLAPRVRHNQFDHFTLQINLGGEVHADGGPGFRAVRPGEILLMDMAKPMRSRYPDAHLVTMTLPRTVAQAATHSVDALHGLIIPAFYAAPLTAFLLSSIKQVDRLRQGVDLNTSGQLTHLLARALCGMGLGRKVERDDLDDERLTVALQYIRLHLADEALSPTRVARATGISRATLYRLFDDSGGVRKYIQERRLAQLKRSLSDPNLDQPVSTLAYDAGFADESHANRSFSKEFGQPPSRFRRQIRLTAQSTYGDQATALKTRLQTWYARLEP